MNFARASIQEFISKNDSDYNCYNEIVNLEHVTTFVKNDGEIDSSNRRRASVEKYYSIEFKDYEGSELVEWRYNLEIMRDSDYKLLENLLIADNNGKFDLGFK